MFFLCIFCKFSYICWVALNTVSEFSGGEWLMEEKNLKLLKHLKIQIYFPWCSAAYKCWHKVYALWSSLELWIVAWIFAQHLHESFEKFQVFLGRHWKGIFIFHRHFIGTLGRIMAAINYTSCAPTKNHSYQPKT